MAALACVALVAALLVRLVRARPGRGPAIRLTLAAGIVGLVNLALGTNFMYLRHKPTVATPLDWMGPWPVYIGACGVVALVLFHVLALPFRRDLYS